MTQANAILGLIAQTSIHAGAGSSVGAVDLPIQREGHNGWPCVFGSAVKGALRTKAAEVWHTHADKEKLFAVFGPETGKAVSDKTPDHAGSLSVGDARLLLLPIRSLSSTFKWITCREALTRLKRDADLLGLVAPELQFGVPDQPQDAESACKAWVPQETDAGSLALEEFNFLAEQKDLSGVISALAALMERDDAQAELLKRLVIVSDEMFSFLVKYATPVAAHIAIKNETKTVQDGALWYEETLPPETLLYVPLMASRSRRKGKEVKEEMDASAIREAVVEGLFKVEGKSRHWLQIGGNETVGMGWCAVKSIKVGG